MDLFLLRISSVSSCSMLWTIQEGFLLVNVLAVSPFGEVKHLYENDNRWMPFAQRYAVMVSVVGSRRREGSVWIGQPETAS